MFNPAPRYGLQERRRSVQLLAGKEGDVPTHQSRQRGCKERKRITRGHSQQPHRPMPTWELLVQQLVAPPQLIGVKRGQPTTVPRNVVGACNY